jgi:hypothetical protein
MTSQRPPLSSRWQLDPFHKSLRSSLPQVAAIKLKHTALALDKGVTIMLLDLDVGFLRDPMILLEGSPLS